MPAVRVPGWRVRDVRKYRGFDPRRQGFRVPLLIASRGDGDSG